MYVRSCRIFTRMMRLLHTFPKRVPLQMFSCRPLFSNQMSQASGRLFHAPGLPGLGRWRSTDGMAVTAPSPFSALYLGSFEYVPAGKR